MFLLPKPKKVEIKSEFYKFKSEDNFPSVFEKTVKSFNNKESYRLFVNEKGVTIEAVGECGFYYGKLTLKQIMLQYKNRIPYLEIFDEPSYSYRGFMIDSCRHFFTVDEIKKMIDGAAFLKFNKFHFHLSEDQGFRFGSEKYPKLIEISSKRKGSKFNKEDYNDIEYGGYYTKDELRDIVNYCKERYIEVIPELDFPGHTTAILCAYPELSCRGKKIDLKQNGGVFPDIMCGGNEKTLEFCKNLIDEMCEIFDGEYFNIGGDEAPKIRWENCEKCKKKAEELKLSSMEQLQGYLTNELSDYLKSKGKKSICWNESLKGNNLNKDITVSLWMDKNNLSSEWANKGGKVIIENFDPLYVDYPYGMHTLKNIFNFNPENNKMFKSVNPENIIGIESPVWTEHITDFKKLSYMCFPRWFGVSEIAWNKTTNGDFSRFIDTTRFYCDIFKEMGHFPADRKEWDMLPTKRIKETASFFLKEATKENIKGLLKKDK